MKVYTVVFEKSLIAKTQKYENSQLSTFATTLHKTKEILKPKAFKLKMTSNKILFMSTCATESIMRAEKSLASNSSQNFSFKHFILNDRLKIK